MALFFPFPASFTYFIIYSHIVPSTLVGVGLVFHRKAVTEAEGAEVRGLPLDTQGRGTAAPSVGVSSAQRGSGAPAVTSIPGLP
jgi:hypothetical protein